MVAKKKKDKPTCSKINNNTFKCGKHTFKLEVKQMAKLTNDEIIQIDDISVETFGIRYIRYADDEQKMENFCVLLRESKDNDIIGFANIGLKTQELTNHMISPKWQGLGLYQYILEYENKWIKDNYPHIMFYLFTEHEYLRKYHVKSGLIELPKQTGEFIGDNGVTYYLGDFNYFTFKNK